MTKKFFVVAIVGFTFIAGWHTSFAFQSTTLENGTLVSKEVYRFPSYEEAVEKTDAEKYASKEEYEKAVTDKTLSFQNSTT